MARTGRTPRPVDRHPTRIRYRRILVIARSPGKGRLTEPTAGAQTRLRFWTPLGDASYPAIATVSRSGIVWCVLAGDTRRELGQVVGHREPRRFVDDKRVRVGADAGVVVKRRQRDT